MGEYRKGHAERATRLPDGALMLVVDENVLRQENEVAPLISHILVPVEFSRRSAGAARFAVELAHRFHSNVTLLHVEKPVENDPFWTAEVTHWAKDEMSDFLPESAEDPILRRIVQVQVDIAGEILRKAAETSADLIVMPTHAYGPIRRVLLGSASARILREAPCPVWTTAQATSLPAQWLEPERILCAVDAGPDGADVLSWASSLASNLNAQLCVAWSRQDLTQMRGQVDKLRRSRRIYAEAVIEAEKVPDVLRQTAKRMRAGLLVVSRNFWNSAARPGLDLSEVVRKAGCPVVCM